MSLTIVIATALTALTLVINVLNVNRLYARNIKPYFLSYFFALAPLVGSIFVAFSTSSMSQVIGTTLLAYLCSSIMVKSMSTFKKLHEQEDVVDEENIVEEEETV